jgi:hypothetical protein
MMLFSDPSFLSSVGQLLVVLGLVGQVSLFFFPAARRLLERSLGVIFTVVAIGGVGLTWRAQDVRDADRNLTPVQQAALSKAIGQFPSVKFEVFAAGDDKEARALALKIIEAVKAGTGAAPPIDDLRSPPLGVVLIVRAKETEFARQFADRVGRVLMEARIAVMRDKAEELDDQTVRIVVGGKP